LKEYLMNPPLLSQPLEGEILYLYLVEILYLYLVVSLSAVSSALIREGADVQRPIYFTSKALQGAEERYLRIENLAFALIVSG